MRETTKTSPLLCVNNVFFSACKIDSLFGQVFRIF